MDTRTPSSHLKTLFAAVCEDEFGTGHRDISNFAVNKFEVKFDLILFAFKGVNIPRYLRFFPKIPTPFNYTHLRQKSNFNDKPCKLTQSIKENISPDFSHSTTILHPQESYRGKAL